MKENNELSERVTAVGSVAHQHFSKIVTQDIDRDIGAKVQVLVNRLKEES